MASLDFFRERLVGLINELDADSLAVFIDRERQTEMLARLAKTIEASHQVAIQTLADLVADDFPDISGSLRESLGDVDEDADQFSESELGFFIYHLNNQTDTLYDGLEANAPVTLSLNLLRGILPEPFILASQTNLLFNATATSPKRKVWVSDDGTVFGTAQYEQLDFGWSKAVINLINTLWNGTIVKPFPTRDSFSTVPLVANAEGGVKIAIIGDWGGGNDLAREVMQTVKELNPDYVIHLGDTYYAGTDQNGTPPNEEQDFLVDFWKKYGPAEEGKCFTLNSNHEMYSGAKGYFKVALIDKMFSAQENYSYFALEFGNWIIAGFDSAYYASLPTYLNGGMGNATDPQYDFLQKVGTTGKNTILMCHHNPISYKGKKDGWFGGQSKFWKQIAETITPDYWYWGHIHLGSVYNDTSAAGSVKSRCIGHSCIPIGTARGLIGEGRVNWFANTPFNDPAEEVYPKGASRIKNGFCMITLTTDGISEDFYDAGSTVPVYSI
jgi:hypothetical protein